MNLKRLLLCMVCLTFSGTALALTSTELEALRTAHAMYARLTSGEWVPAGFHASAALRRGVAEAGCRSRTTVETKNQEIDAIKYLGKDGQEVILECPPKRRH